MDKAHEWTDVRLAKIERELKKIYRRSFEEIDKKTKDYFSQFAEEDKIKRALFESGKIDRAEYDRWRRTKTLQGQHWEQMREAIVQEHLKVRRTALAYINGQLPEIYAKNYNVFVNMYSSLVAGGSYEQVSASTVKNLALSDKSLLPYKQVNTRKYERWCTKKVNAELLQGVLQGDPISDIADRLQRVTVMDRTAAIRNARTTVTSAENKGRLDSLKTAEENGLLLSKRWLSVDDNRTRHEHHLLNGQETELDEPFTVNGMDIMYPGDPNAEASLVYNCRCTLTSEVKGIRMQSKNDKIIDLQHVAEDGNIYDKWDTSEIKVVERANDTAEPLSINCVINQKGGHTFHLYDEMGRRIKEISDNKHYPNHENYGKNGEHIHNIIRFGNRGNQWRTKGQELTEKERTIMEKMLWTIKKNSSR